MTQFDDFGLPETSIVEGGGGGDGEILNESHCASPGSNKWNNTQWCKFMGKNLKFALESGADGEGKHARRRNQNRGAFHALPAP